MGSSRKRGVNSGGGYLPQGRHPAKRHISTGRGSMNDLLPNEIAASRQHWSRASPSCAADVMQVSERAGSWRREQAGDCKLNRSNFGMRPACRQSSSSLDKAWEQRRRPPDIVRICCYNELLHLRSSSNAHIWTAADKNHIDLVSCRLNETPRI
jgi:hypothetical protein